MNEESVYEHSPLYFNNQCMYLNITHNDIISMNMIEYENNTIFIKLISLTN